MSGTDVPDSVTHRGVREVLRTFAASDWTAMTLEIGGITITVGKNGPPTAVAAPGPAAPAPVLQESHVPATGVRESGFPATPEGPAAAPSPPVPAPPVPPVDTTGLVEVRSPAVGAFWVAPSPGEPPFVEVGSNVGENEQLAIVEVMKLMNPVVTPRAGVVVQVLAANAEMVEYDQVLFLIRPSDA
ncbi:biotin/lipoyl-containing protein [Pseudonocardia oceani]|uniref:Acetyl-CoA carboxylase biotin carboxyl carrier protein subunit n=2 Tax=Pseudonocardia oceani TaxID=2792013 RepID=A0ABS6UD08_9PSEU|nr:biotin/lipoyl-containing protein [Pseudonocardia oceani]MBW0130131.1 acetyl-CoA carboxylase biotin carboxyl carrier protein subunit [Pseudonocardia oceani]